MTDVKQEGQKTVVSFIVGLLIGGLLVWAFSGPEAKAPNDKKDDVKEESAEMTNDDSKSESSNEEAEIKVEVATPVATLPVGDGKVSINNQNAGTIVDIASATYPVEEGWIGVRDYQNGQLGALLGVARFSKEQGLVPTNITLQRSTTAGKEYAVVVYTESGDKKFNLAEDKQIDSIFATFTAQ